MRKVVVVDYDPDWPRRFERLCARIRPALEALAFTIEHVGSTAVPGLPAKPVIDLDVVVAAEDVPRAVERLRSIGYAHRGDLGIPGREAFHAPSELPPHHLYVCTAHGPALANHLAVRDHLRRNPAVARAYGALKRRLARKYADDVDGYVEAKSDFLIAILRELEFSAEVLADIERRNRRDFRGE